MWCSGPVLSVGASGVCLCPFTNKSTLQTHEILGSQDSGGAFPVGSLLLRTNRFRSEILISLPPSRIVQTTTAKGQTPSTRREISFRTTSRRFQRPFRRRSCTMGVCFQDHVSIGHCPMWCRNVNRLPFRVRLVVSLPIEFSLCGRGETDRAPHSRTDCTHQQFTSEST